MCVQTRLESIIYLHFREHRYTLCVRARTIWRDRRRAIYHVPPPTQPQTERSARARDTTTSIFYFIFFFIYKFFGLYTHTNDENAIVIIYKDRGTVVRGWEVEKNQKRNPSHVILSYTHAPYNNNNSSAKRA